MAIRGDKTQQNAALLVAVVSSFLTPFMTAALNIALPAIGAEYRLDAGMLGWVTIAYSLAAAIFLVPFGKLSDMAGRKRVFLVGISVFTLSSALTPAMPTAALLIAARILQGLGAAMIFSTSIAILAAYFPSGERGRALGFTIAATYAGLSAGPFLGGLLVQHLGWRSVFIAAVPLGILSILLLLWKLGGDWDGAPGGQFDLAGSLLYGVSLALLMYGLRRLPAAEGAVIAAVGIAGLAAFVWWETRAPNPILSVALFVENRGFALSNLAALITYTATSAVGFLLSLYLQYVKGFDAKTAGVVLIAQPVIQAAFSPLAGRLSDRIEARAVASGGIGVIIVGLSALAFLGESSSAAFIIVCQVLLGLGFALFSSPNMNAIMGSVSRPQHGIASAMLGTMRVIGQMSSLAIATLILALVVGPVQITPERYPAFVEAARITFGVSAVLSAGGIFASLARGRINSR